MPEITSQLTTALADRYKIERHLGEGGMAIVYLAHDLRHDRRVALKVLRPELAAVIGAERFLTEIRVTANLQHPHILPLHDSGDAGSFLYYVMPFIEGDTLRDKLNRERQLAIEDAVEITRSISSALDYAHRQNVIHRDIKPENVLMHDGQPLVADFGIALAVREASGQRLTETGLSLGTPHYMSPEQAMGDRELDARSDIYSLGAMLYEMLAGEPPYHGPTAQAIVAKVITEKAPMVSAARDTVPPHINAAIAKALNKMPADRFSSAAAFADALTNPAFSIPSTSVAGAPTVPRDRTGRRRAALLAAAAAGATLVMGFIGGRASAPEPAARLTRFVVPAPEGVREYSACCGPSAALSPDGQWLVFVGVGGGGGRSPLYRRHISQLEAEEIPGTDDPSAPFFSPDSRWVGFGTGGRLRKVPIAGGPPLDAADESIVQPGTENVEAYNTYLQGRYALAQRADGLQRGLELFRQAVELDPLYAQAHAGIADAYALLGIWAYQDPTETVPMARAAAELALSIDPTLAAAHAMLGFIATWVDWDRESAERHFQQAIALDSTYASAHQWFGEETSVLRNDRDLAIEQLEIAVSLDPLAPQPVAVLATMYSRAGRHDEAIETARRAVQLQPSWSNYAQLASVFTSAGYVSEAVAAADSAIAASGRNPIALLVQAPVYNQLGDTVRVQAIYDELLRQSETRYVPPTALGVLQLLLGENADGKVSLERALARRDPLLMHIVAGVHWAWPRRVLLTEVEALWPRMVRQ